jgi:hypothetical protein
MLDALRELLQQNPKAKASIVKKKIEALKEQGVICEPKSIKGKRGMRNAGRPKRSRTAKMTEERFWGLIEEGRCARNICSALTAALKRLSAKEIIAFENMFRRKLADAYLFPVLAANFIIESYVSDDVFESFRAWLVSQGRQRFEAALADPESICDWLERKGVWSKAGDNAVDRQGEQMLFVAQNAYARYGDEEDFADQTTYPRKPALKVRWPEGKAGFRKRWPRLVDKFWNQALIKELHSF